MITHDQLLPSLYHMQRAGPHRRHLPSARSDAAACRPWPRRLGWPKHFPDSRSADIPMAPTPLTARSPISSARPSPRMPPRNIVVAAVPDQLHFEVVMTALAHDQHVCAVKPLVLKHAQAREIAREAYARGLVVGIEYHKRFDDRSLMARRKYRDGPVRRIPPGNRLPDGEVVLPPFQFSELVTTENSDAFTYIGCHYVDLVALHHRTAARRRSACTASPTVSQRQRRLPLDRRARHLEQRRLPQRAELARLPRCRSGHQYARPDDVLQGRDRTARCWRIPTSIAA